MWRIFSTAVFCSVLAMSLVSLILPLRAEGKLDTLEKFSSGKTEMVIATYYDPDAAGGQKVGLIGISAPKRNSFAFEADEWEQLIALCSKAVGIQGTAWTAVGSMTETGTTDVSKITISAGPGVRFVISSPKGVTVTYVLPKSDAPRFQKGLVRVRDFLAK
jgi:hypothetical protein